MEAIKKFFPAPIFQFIKIYFSAILFFSIFRLILFLTQLDRIDETVSRGDIIGSFLMGVRFDIVISSYILILPFILMSIHSFLKYRRGSLIFSNLVSYYIILLFSLAFLVCAMDIPYFNQFFSRFSVAAFDWLDSPAFVFKMIFQEYRYWIFILPFLLIVYLFIRFIKSVFHAPGGEISMNSYIRILMLVLFLGFIFLGIRGRIEEKSPIRVGTAYFSNNAFLNMLGLNPNFTLIRSYLDSRKPENDRISLMDDSSALLNMQRYLNIGSPDPVMPLLRRISPDSTRSEKQNVVVVIMESMSAAKMSRQGNADNLTPFLDSISQKGYYFENAYTAGIHTKNGVFSTLFSFPALFRQHPMPESAIRKYHGLFSTLKGNGYSTIYFTTHDGQFDNVEGFLKANDCETFVSKPDYPAEMIKTTLGVPDDFMFEFSIPMLDKLYGKNKPFAAVYMTASDHGPYYIPDFFKPKSKEIKKKIVEYADFSLRKFIELSSRRAWFRNTIFVFIADHGDPGNSQYSMSIDYNHSPLLFYAPELFKDYMTLDKMAGQIDIFPTLMGLLRIPYINNTLGIDLFRENRPFIFFNADDKYGVIDQEWFLIVQNDKTMELFRYRDSDTHDYAGEKPEIAERMNLYAKSNLQAYQYILTHQKQ